VTTPKLEIGTELLIVTSWLLAPLKLRKMGELSCISCSGRRLHEITTRMFVSISLASLRLEVVDFAITAQLGGRETGTVVVFVRVGEG
jgi:hypothetical protein